MNHYKKTRVRDGEDDDDEDDDDDEEEEEESEPAPKNNKVSALLGEGVFFGFFCLSNQKLN